MPIIPTRTPAIAEHGSLAYLTHRRVEASPACFELGAIGHGPTAGRLARRLVEHVTAWNTDRERRPHLEARDIDAPIDQPAHRLTIHKHETQLVLTLQPLTKPPRSRGSH